MVGKTLTLKATVTPKNATNQKLTWKSSNTKVATIYEDISNLDINLISEAFNLETWNKDFAEITIVSSFPKETVSFVVKELPTEVSINTRSSSLIQEI